MGDVPTTGEGAGREPSEAATSDMGGRADWGGGAMSGAGGPGGRIGPYRLLELLGEGGFGVVWLAEQTQPVRRRVALKVIKPGMDSKAVIARFEAERQALAMMSHPCVAKVLDVGTTDRGLPFFVMEHVKGLPITTYCDQNRLTIEKRLALFVQVCDAVQHAHMKGIIHRDLKPSNILVTVAESGEARPVVIDFGVAKALASRLTEQTIFTERGQLIGTPEYMSPEQAEMSEADIDTRTDVYSLGVILYELLTGAVPFDSRSLRAAGVSAIQKLIREQDPPRPSTRLSTKTDASAAAAEARQTQLEALASVLRRELEWIPLRALRKDRTERYRSASELADDVGNYLAHRPLIAGPESAAYKARKFVRRNKGLVAAAGAVLGAVVLGVTGIVWQAKVASDQRDRAILAETETSKRADELQKVSDFQAKMLGQVDPTEAGKLLTADVIARFEAALTIAGVPEAERRAQTAAFAGQWERVSATDAARELIDRTILRPAVAAIDKEFAEQPVVDARLRQVLADLYGDLGMYEAALPLQKAALATRRRELGDDHKDTLSSIGNTGYLLQLQGKLNEAEPYVREVLERKRRVLGEEHEDTLVAIGNMGSQLYYEGKLAEAEPYYQQVLEKSRRILGDKHDVTLKAIGMTGTLLKAQGKLDQAEPYFREAMEKSRTVLGEDAPDTLNAIGNMATLLQAQGKLAESEPLCREVMMKMRKVMGEDHPRTLIAVSELDILLQLQGKLAEAEPLSREALQKQRRVLGDEQLDTMISFNSLAGLLNKLGGRSAEVVALLSPVEPTARRVLVGSHAVRLGQFLMHLGGARTAEKDFAAAENNLLEAHEVLVATLGPTKKTTRASVQALIDLYRAWDAAESGKGYGAKAEEWAALMPASNGTPNPR